MYYIFRLFSGSMSGIKPEEMTVIDHLEEFRGRLIRSFLALLVFTILAFLYMPFIFQNVIFAATKPDFWTYQTLCKFNICLEHTDIKLQNRTMAGQFTTHVTSSLVAGLIMAFPYFTWQLWKFIKPALIEKEAKTSIMTVFVMPVLFITGISFGYYVIAPLSIHFLANYRLDPSIINEFDISSYISTIFMLVLGCALIFQLPVIIYFLTIIGFVTPSGMKKYRKYSIIGIFFIAAMITPSPDVITQLLVALPIYMLYEASIYLSGYVYRKKAN